MSLFKSDENRVRCGKCGTEFDLNRNKDGCPLCGFGNKKEPEILINEKVDGLEKKDFIVNYLMIPPELKLKSGKVIANEETKIWGSWLMFNDFFAPKFLTRTLAWKINNEKKDYISLKSLMEESILLIKKYGLSELKGFPNLKKDSEGSRLVHHFLVSTTKMGMFEVESTNFKAKDVWKEKFENINVKLTKEGLEFARLKNPVFDEGKKEQVLSEEEKDWLINYLKKIDKEGYREYSVLKEVYEFLKAGNNGNKDLWNWFEKNKKFQDYIKERIKKARKDPGVFEKQLSNYAKTFASAKVSLLRELGVIKNKRNDYTIIGELK